MKIISLNTATGKFLNPLITFIREQTSNTDIFCLQEVTVPHKDNLNNDLQTLLSPILSNYQTYIFDYEWYDCGSIVTYIKNDIPVVSSTKRVLYTEYIETHHWMRNNSWLMLDTIIDHYNWSIHIIHIHGLRFPWNKLDTPSRDKQTTALIDYISQYNSNDQFIIVWDFNLHSDSKLISLLSEQYTNLNTKFHITDTRWAWCLYYGKIEYQRYSDYAFSSQNIICANFSTYEEVISDHKALLLHFDI